ncbi:MAG: hypothetical protein NUW01_12115 [Gemmatimonadaceae bacterium]|nr:hypothetical protein [Gemmatimonadaceae bacterium]
MTAFAIGFDKAQSDYNHAEPDDEPGYECRCPDNCATCNLGGGHWIFPVQSDGSETCLYCCGRCQDEDDGPDPDDERDRRIDREMDQ